MPLAKLIPGRDLVGRFALISGRPYYIARDIDGSWFTVRHPDYPDRKFYEDDEANEFFWCHRNNMVLAKKKEDGTFCPITSE